MVTAWVAPAASTVKVAGMFACGRASGAAVTKTRTARTWFGSTVSATGPWVMSAPGVLICAPATPLNATWAVTDMLTLAGAATWLDTEIDDLLQACYFGQTYAQGCNLDPNGNPTGGTRGSQQDVSGNSMVLAPELSYNASARLDFPPDSLPFSAYAMLVYTWTDDIQYGLTYDPLLKQEDYQLLDLFIGIEDKQGRYQVSVFGKNLTDDYFDPGISEAYGSQGRVVGRPSRGAQTYYGLKARYNF